MWTSVKLFGKVHFQFSGCQVYPLFFSSPELKAYWLLIGLTLTCFKARSNLVPYVFVWEKGKTIDFSETIAVYDIKVGRCS